MVRPNFRDFLLYDINCLGYLGLIAFLLLFFHRNVHLWPVYILAHVALITAILIIVRLDKRYSGTKLFWLLRSFYPIGVMIFAWEELNALILMFFDSHWVTDLLVRGDELIFGVQPTLWVQQFYRPWLDECMYFFYTGYYLLFLIVPLALVISRKRRELHAILSFITFLYLGSFVLFFLFPAVGPNRASELVSLDQAQPSGYLFAWINRQVQAHMGIAGAAFPSSHVAGAFVWVFTVLRYQRKLGYFLIPIPLGITAASIYLGLHHVLDPLFGILWAGVCALLVLKWLQRRGEDPLSIF